MTSLVQWEGLKTTTEPQSACWPSMVGRHYLGRQTLLREGVPVAFREFLMVHFVENLSKQKTRLTWKVKVCKPSVG